MNVRNPIARLYIWGLLFVGCLTALVYSESSARFPVAVTEAQTRNDSQFRYISGGFHGEYASYNFQTPPSEKNFADDCIGCEEEVGNASIFAEFGCPKKSKYLFESNSGNDNRVVEKTSTLDSQGSVVGEERLIVFKNKKGEIYAARLFWIEGSDFWTVQAPTVELTKALKESAEYKKIRQKVAEEIKAYVPIQNANTKLNKPC